MSQIKAKGGKAVFVKADVSSAKDSENMIQVAEKTFGKLNIVQQSYSHI